MAIEEDARSDGNPTVCTVVGGRSSFVGRSLVTMLLRSPRWTVRIADSQPSLQLGHEEENSILADSIRTGRASYFQVDIRDKSQISLALRGSSVVFHMDAMGASAQDFYHQYMFTVQGTKNIINACRECKVERLIYNSSADVVFDGIHDIHNGDESLPYPLGFEDKSNDLKAQAEALVLFANSSDGLLTCALRPSNPFGPGDTHLVPLLVREAKSGWAKFIVGNDINMCDYTYVENIAHAHICAEQVLCSEMSSVAGKYFFITNLEPLKLWEFASLILEGLGYQRPRIHIPVRLVLIIVTLVEWVYEKFGLQRNALSRIRLNIIHTFSCTRTFNCCRAQNILRYSPIVSLEEGITLTVESFSHLAEKSPHSRERDFTVPSKVDKLLGGGRVADILLWRDEKETFSYIVGLFLLFYWFLLSGRTFITSTAKLLLLISVLLFGHGCLPSSMFGFTLEKISSSYFEVSDTAVRTAFIYLASVWNRGVFILNSLARGEDGTFFFKAASSLYIFKLLLQFPPSIMIRIGLVSLFTVFFIYEQYEEEVDRIMRAAAVGANNLMEILVMKLPGFMAEYVHKNKR